MYVRVRIRWVRNVYFSESLACFVSCFFEVDPFALYRQIHFHLVYRVRTRPKETWKSWKNSHMNQGSSEEILQRCIQILFEIIKPSVKPLTHNHNTLAWYQVKNKFLEYFKSATLSKVNKNFNSWIYSHSSFIVNVKRIC